MRARIWIAGLAAVLVMVWMSTAHGGSSQPMEPMLRTVANEDGGNYESAGAGNAAVLRRNAFQDIEVRDTLVYCLQGNDCGDSCASLMILSISNPTQPRFISRLRFHGNAVAGFELAISGNRAYMTVGDWDSTTVYIVEVADPNSPAVLGSFVERDGGAAIDVTDTLLLVAGFQRVCILNIADPADVQPVACTSPLSDTYLTELQVDGNYVHVSGCCKMYTLDISSPSNILVTDSLSTGYWPIGFDVQQDDTLIYVADADILWPDYWSAFTVVNAARPAGLSVLSHFPLFGSVLDVKVRGDWAYVSHGSCGLQVFNISDPASPDSVARAEIPRLAGRIALHDTLLIMPDIGPFVADPEGFFCYPPSVGPNDPQEGDLLIINIADPTNPTLLGFYRPTAQDPTGVDDVEPEVLPTTFSLYQNYPNPFNPGTMIEFDLPERAEVSLSVYNLLGQEVTRLVQSRSAGHHTIQLNLRDQSSGVYFYELRAGDYSGTGKMLLLK